MKTRVIFIPWRVALEQTGDALQWQAAGVLKGKWFDIVHYNTLLRPLTLKRMWEGSVYIFGHGAPGDGTIAPGGLGIGSSLSYSVVADRLIFMGLGRPFRGKIKLFSCYSGEGGDRSFAKRFADYMRERKKYDSCTYEGYTEELFSKMHFLWGQGGGLHRWAGAGPLAYADRASARRIEV